MQLFARIGLKFGLRGAGPMIWAHSPVSARLAAAAASEPADLYIGHCLAALPAVALAAQMRNAVYGFDIEDDHLGELEQVKANALERRIRENLFERYLPGCQHLTASSPGIAAAIRERHDVEPVVVLNVFPLKEGPKSPSQEPPEHGRSLQLYWFSQTIGPGRGLEEVTEALARVTTPVSLSLRGQPIPEFVEALRQRIPHRPDAIRILPSAMPGQMAELSAEHDIGLSVDLSTPPNRDLCLTNKVFTYLLAGLPVLMSRTSAHSDIAGQLGIAGWCVDINDREATAALIEQLASDRRAVVRSAQHSWKLGRTRFNWDREQSILLGSVRRALENLQHDRLTQETQERHC